MAKRTFEEWVNIFKNTHGNKYKYLELVKGKGRIPKIKYFCTSCGNECLQNVYDHAAGHGCKYCHFKKISKIKRKPKEEILKELNSLKKEGLTCIDVFYKNYRAYVVVQCDKGHTFAQGVFDYKKYKNCPICIGTGRKPKEKWIKEFKEVVGDAYEYLDVIYKNNKTYFKVRCTKCGNIEIKDAVHIKRGNRCFKCYGTHKSNTQEFIEKSKKLFGENTFGYSKVVYKNNRTKVLLKCNKCNREFFVTPNHHLSSMQGCPFCRLSKGEQKIITFLEKFNISFIHQYKVKIKNTKHIFDFYLPNYNIMIEYQGEYHYQTIGDFYKEKDLEKRIEKDLEKQQYCLGNGIQLLEIPYWDFKNINSILNEELLLKYAS